MTHTPHPAFNACRPFETSDFKGPTIKSTLASRRSVHRLGSSSDDPLKLLVEPAKPSRQECIQVNRKPRLPVSQQTLMSKKPTIRPPSISTTAGRRSRLPQVGRIPKVVSNRTEHVSSIRFRRPFRASMQLAPENLEVYDPESLLKGPSPSRPSIPVPGLTTDSSTSGSTDNLSSRDSNPPALSRVEKELLVISPRKDSEGTIGTSCSSCSGMFAFSGSTAGACVEPVLLHGSEAWYPGTNRPRWIQPNKDTPSRSSFRTRLRRTDELLGQCARPKLIQKRFQKEQMPPLQTTSKEKTAEAFLRWSKSLDPLTLVV
ncbi:hypothetical protein FANTH_14181 [Fusarium anthophilum]|uniref:Uncharacterized protein n=1 Tax=Fusarium anthophilum TaxID=48485 RepID=A0A8H5DN44_9HYPO|nr:hypothetical protein FANTH_14181 [Fusarium anthophilum]